MNYYSYNKKSQYKGAKKRITLNIIIVIVLILAIAGGTLVLGNSLKKKLDNSDVSHDTIVTSPAETEQKEVTDDTLMTFKKDRTYVQLASVSGFLDLADCPDEGTAEKYVDFLCGSGYTGVTFSAYGTDGKLSYNSQALSDEVAAHVTGSVTSFEKLRAAFTKAKANSMKITVLIPLPDLSDQNGLLRAISKTVIGELGNIGADQFVFLSALSPDDFSSSRADILYQYVSEIREKVPDADIGMELDKAILDNPEMTPVLELVFRFTDFFALDFSDTAEWGTEAQSSFLKSHGGSMGAYNIRIMSGSVTPDEIVSEYAVLKGTDKLSVSFVKPLEFTPQYGEDGAFIFESKMPAYTVEAGLTETDINDNDE